MRTISIVADSSTEQRRREAAGTHNPRVRTYFSVASHVLPNAIFWEAKRNQVSDFSAASSHNASQPPKADID
jgi:hypothetical protein